METEEKIVNKLDLKTFTAERVDKNRITITRKKGNKKISMYVFSANDIAELKSIKPSDVKSNSFFSRFIKEVKVFIVPIIFSLLKGFKV